MDLGDLQLTPGLRVVRRGRDHLQVGLYDGRRTLLPRSDVVEATLGALAVPAGARPPSPPDGTDPETAAVLELLQHRGCIAPREQDARRGRLRGAGRVCVLGGVPGGTVRDLLTRAGVRLVRTGDQADVVVVLGPGEVDRELLDPLVRDGTSHVVVRLVDGAALVGPFVVPGRTPCVRCIDAQLSVADPDHVVVTSRYVRATRRPRGDGVPDVCDPALTALAEAWAVWDVVAHLEERRPATWSRTLFLDVEPTRWREQEWRRHPECGCSWSGHAPLSGTMEE